MVDERKEFFFMEFTLSPKIAFQLNNFENKSKSIQIHLMHLIRPTNFS